MKKNPLLRGSFDRQDQKGQRNIFGIIRSIKSLEQKGRVFIDPAFFIGAEHAR
jgi:hypothetical protein